MTRLLSSCAVAAGLLFACGSRGPLDDEPQALAEDGGAPDAPRSLDAATDAPAEAGTVPREAGPAACAECVLTTCTPRILTCLQSSPCAAIFQCILTTCLRSGGVESSCVLGCAARDPVGALQVLGIVQCLSGDCRSACPVLGNLGR
jgi:hypothetical protein